jgi:hypothetical protein
MPKKIWLELGVSQTWITISIAGIKEVAGNGTNVLYAKGNQITMLVLRKSDNV